MNKKQPSAKHKSRVGDKVKSQSEGEVVQIRFPKSTKANSCSEKGGGCKLGEGTADKERSMMKRS